MNIQILTSAYADLRNGRLFYESQLDGLGAYFLDSLFSDIDSLALYAGIHQKVFGYYRMLSSRFPYSIYYKLDGPNHLTFWRVLDSRQKPEAIVKHLVDK